MDGGEFGEDGGELAEDGGEFAEDGGELAVDDSTQGVPSADEYDVYSFFDAADTPDPGKLCHMVGLFIGNFFFFLSLSF